MLGKHSGRLAWPVAVASLLGLALTLGVTVPVVAHSSSPAAVKAAQNQRQLIEVLRQDRAGRALAAQSQVVRLLRGIAANQRQLRALNRVLARDTGAAARLRAQLAGDSAALAGVIRTAYVTSSGSETLGTAIASSTLTAFVNASSLPAATAANLTSLVVQVERAHRGIRRALAGLQAARTKAAATEAALNRQAQLLLIAAANRDAAFQAASAAAQRLLAELANQGAPVASGGTCGNHFYYGECTWYVATRRCIPWFGNADQWWGAAAAYGYAEGHTPAVGAVAVFATDAYSPMGHVAYVQALGKGQFEVAEMNYSGWAVVDYRWISDSSSSIVGFIYGHS